MMAKFLIKPDPMRDMYVAWSSVTNTPVALYLSREDAVLEHGLDLIVRVDIHGTSASYLNGAPGPQQEGGYESLGLHVSGEATESGDDGFLAREHFPALLKLLVDDIDARIPADLLEEYEEDEQ